MKVVIYGPNLAGMKHTFHVHKAGCGDLRRGIYPAYRHEAWEIETPSLRNIVENVYDSPDFWQGENPDVYWKSLAHEFEFFPCVKLPDEDKENGK